MKTSYALALVSTIMLALCAVPANAASNRTWVSGTGSNSNPCTRTQPCATFQTALANTNAGGEIDCLDAGDFGGALGTLTINQSVSIVCGGVSNGGVLNSNGDNAIYIGATGAVVYLSGLNINGLAGAGGVGVQVSSASDVYIVHCTIQSFAGQGVYVDSSATARVVIKDSTIVNNGSGAVLVKGTGATNAVILINTAVDGNGSVAAKLIGSQSVTGLERTLLTGSATGLDLTNGASAELIGPSNAIAGAIIGTTTSVPFK